MSETDIFVTGEKDLRHIMRPHAAEKSARVRKESEASSALATPSRERNRAGRQTKSAQSESLTAAQQDYVEAVARLFASPERIGATVRITDIARLLGTRLPTVTRTVARLAEQGIFVHESRQGVRLTARGDRLASAFVHRHDDLVRFFVVVLGLSPERAEQDTCQLEHGLSEASAQRLHEFLEFIELLPEDTKKVLLQFASRPSLDERPFEALPDQKVSGWRS